MLSSRSARVLPLIASQDDARLDAGQPLASSVGTQAIVGPVLLTPRDAARLLAISERTLWGLTQRREIRSVRIGRSVRYAMADLATFVDGLRATPESK